MTRSLIIDIETIPTWDRSGIVGKADGRLKDPDKIAVSIAESVEKQVEASSCEPTLGTICCIGWGWGSDPHALWADPQKKYGDRLRDAVLAEGPLLEQLDPLLLECDRIITWNGTFFDIPFLIKRAMKHGVWGVARSLKALPHIDLKRTWAFNEPGWATSSPGLDEVAKFLGVELKPSITGKEVGAAYMMGDLNSIDIHVKNDILAITKVAEACGKAGLIDYGTTLQVAA